MQAVFTGDLDEVKLLMSRNSDVGEKNQVFENMSPLQLRSVEYPRFDTFVACDNAVTPPFPGFGTFETRRPPAQYCPDALPGSSGFLTSNGGG